MIWKSQEIWFFKRSPAAALARTLGRRIRYTLWNARRPSATARVAERTCGPRRVAG